MTDPNKFIKFCTFDDLLNFRKDMAVLEYGSITNKVRLYQIAYVAVQYLGFRKIDAANKLGTSSSNMSAWMNRAHKHQDKTDDMVRELGYWKYLQMNNKIHEFANRWESIDDDLVLQIYNLIK